MITNLFIDIIVLILGAIFSNFDIITKLPLVNGFDIDAALITGIGSLNTFMDTFWPIDYMFKTFLLLVGYYILKMIATTLFGSRSFGHK